MKKTLLLIFAIAASLNLVAQDNTANNGGVPFVADNQQTTIQNDSIKATLIPVEAIEVEKKSDKAVKIYENGQLYILRNGKKYNLLGVEVE